MKIAAYFQVNGVKVFPLVNQPFQKHEIPIESIGISPRLQSCLDYLEREQKDFKERCLDLFRM